MAKSKHNWDEIGEDYTTGKLTYRELAIKYKVSESRMNTVGGKRKWRKKRQAYRDSVTQAVTDEKKKTTVLEKSRFDELTTRVCDTVAASMAVLSTKEYEKEPLSPARASEILSAARQAQEVKYRALGIPPPKTASQIDEEEAYKHYLERLADARARLEAEGKIIKRSKGNGRPVLKPNDFIEIEIEEPTQSTSKN